jgi:hypothetical protein
MRANASPRSLFFSHSGSKGHLEIYLSSLTGSDGDGVVGVGQRGMGGKVRLDNRVGVIKILLQQMSFNNAKLYGTLLLLLTSSLLKYTP